MTAVTIIGIIIFFILILIFKIILEQRMNELEKIEKQLNEKTEILKTLQDKILETTQEYSDKNKYFESIYETQRIAIENRKSEMNLDFEKFKSNLQEQQKNLQEEITELNAQKDETQNKINKIKEQYKNLLDLQLKEKEQLNNLAFYTLAISDKDLADIQILNKMKAQLSNPLILSKLIWTTYFQKETTDLCNRIVGSNIVRGIYKITNLETNEVYIGQSVDISSRLKAHIKCGLGINTPAENKLYKNMQKYGVENFKYEVVEKCAPDISLNEREKFYIDFYQSAIIGLNTLKGNNT